MILARCVVSVRALCGHLHHDPVYFSKCRPKVPQEDETLTLFPSSVSSAETVATTCKPFEFLENSRHMTET